MMSNESDSNYLNQIKEEELQKKTETSDDDKDTFIDEVEFKSKTSNKPDEHFYVSKINKPAKLKDDPNFFQSLLFQFSKDNTSGMAAQLAYYFLLAIFPLLIFLLTLVPLFNIDQG